MIKFVTFLAFAISQVLSGAVEVFPAAAVAPVASAVVTAHSSQYFAQNHNAFAAPLIAPVAPVVEAVAPVPARIEAVAPVAARVQAPLAQFIAPSSASFSQVTRYGQYNAPYFAAPYVSAPLVQAPLVQAPFVARAAPLLAKSVVAPLVARGPVAVPVGQPIAPAQPVAAPQQPQNIPVVPAPNPDAESVDIESARLRALPETRNQPAEQQRQVQQNFARYQQQLRAQQRQRSDQSQQETQPSARNQVQPQQQSAAPGFLSQQQYIQGPY